MNHIKAHKKIGVAIVVLLLIFGIIFYNRKDTFAKDDNKKDTNEEEQEQLPSCSTFSDSKITNRYNAAISYNSDSDIFTVTIGASSSNSELRNKLRQVVFNVVSIGGRSVGGTVSYGNPYKFKWSEEGSFDVVLQNDQSTPDPECTGSITLTLPSYYGKPKTESPNLEETKDYVDETQDNVSTDNSADTSASLSDNGGKTGYDKPLDCSSGSLSAFEKEICTAKEKKENKATDFSNASPEKSKFQCDPNQFLKDSELEGEKYYTNKKYLYGTKKIVKTTEYKYHLSPGSNPKTEQASCEVQCEEGLVVDYGPPVASKAGLCFQYKVRVTSRVRCYTSKQPQKPNPNKYPVCTPAPVCTNTAHTYETKQGGPTEEFDKCIKKCDGGKYSTKCSNSCYKKVYGKAKTTKTSNDTPFAYNTLKLADEDFSLSACIADSRNKGGCYVRSGNGIVWRDNGARLPGRYYTSGGAWKHSSEYAIVQDDGFYRHVYGGGSYCHDICTWVGCGSNSYLNYGFAEKDKKVNDEAYNKLVKECKSAASCSENTTEFTISVDYTDGNNTKQTVSFPYQSSSDKLSSRGAKAKQNTSTNNNTTILNQESYEKFMGCYLQTGPENIYRTTWSFPGSWINLKTGEISYKEKTDGSWRTMDRKFCMPLDARNVNEVWWNTYYGKQLAKITNETSATSQEVMDKCFGGTSLANSNTKTKFSVGDIIYNIHANTTKFGYMGWDIDVDCFYALNNKPGRKKTSSAEDENTNAQCRTDSTNQRIRTYDPENPFPGTDGTTGSGGTTSSSSSSKSNGDEREPGYNWSKYANISSGKNSAYISNPQKYLQQIKQLGYNVYEDDHLDYQFDLTPEKLQQLKKELKQNGSNYTSYNDGKTTIGKNSGVSRYRSNVIREYSDKLPNDDTTLDCNNIYNYRRTGCDTSAN